MTALNFSQLLAKKDARCTFEYTPPGFEPVLMHELTSKESEQCFEESNNLPEGDIDANDACIAKWACWMLKGGEPEADEIKAFRENYSRHVLISIRDYGLQWAGETAAAKEGIEKN